MVWKRQLLIVASVPATSGDLFDALRDRATRDTVAFTLIVPATPVHGGRTAARQQVDEAVMLLRGFGLEVEGSVGDGDPMVAVTEAWDPKRYDEIILWTLPTSVSKWLHADLPQRIEKHTGALVTHVVAQPPQLEPEVARIPESEKLGVMTPFSALAWGGPRRARSKGVNAGLEPDQ